jgi:hypothetical protein
MLGHIPIGNYTLNCSSVYKTIKFSNLVNAVALLFVPEETVFRTTVAGDRNVAK